MSRDIAPRQWLTSGHDDALAMVERAIELDRIPHSWLITGPTGIGRTTLAIDIARALNCERDAAHRPCGVCRQCRLIADRRHPDVLVADMEWQRQVIPQKSGNRARDRREFSIDAIRTLRADLATRPLVGRWRVLILDDADRLSDAAPDAFLKSLEEPPPFVVLVLVAGSPEQVPETVRSRCREVALGLVGRASIVAELTRRGATAEQAARIARIARGRPAWAIAAMSDPEVILRRSEAIEAAFEQLTTPLGRAEIVGVFASSHSQRRETTYAALGLWLGMWRDILLCRTGIADFTQFPEVTDRLVQWSAGLPIAEIYRSIEATRRCMRDLDDNVLARIALQAMVAQWPR